MCARAAVALKSVTHHVGITQVQGVPHKTLRQGVGLLTHVVFVCFNRPVRGYDFIWGGAEKKRDRQKENIHDEVF